MWQVAAQKCGINGLRVLLFLFMTKNQEEWDAVHFASWMGQTYTLGYQNWKKGTSELAEYGLIDIREGKIYVRKKQKSS